MCEYVANLICGCKDKAFIWIVQASTNHSTRNSAEWCESSGTGTLVRYLSRISGTYPYESDGITINSQRLNFLFLQACGF